MQESSTRESTPHPAPLNTRTPRGHFVQALELLAPVIELKVPTGQLSQLLLPSRPVNDPSGHTRQELDPEEGEKRPAMQAVHASASRVCPATRPYLPAWHTPSHTG